MAWNDLKAAVAAVIKTNGTQSITGAILQSTLNSIIDQVGANSTFKGVATPSTNPGIPDGPLFYLAAEKGVYSNFGGQSVSNSDGLVVLLYSSVWGKYNIPIATKTELDQLAGEVTNFQNTVNNSLTQITAQKQVFESEAQEIKDAVANMTTTGKIYDSLAYAIAENPKPENGTPFSVMGDGDNDGYWKFDSTQPDGVKFGRKFDRRIQVESISLLKSYIGRPGESVDVLGYYESGDGGGGLFYWDSISTESDNGGTIFAPDPLFAGRWKRVFSEKINVLCFGISAGSTDNTAAINKIIDYASTMGVRDIIFNKGEYLVTGPINIKSNITISAYGSVFKTPSSNDTKNGFYIREVENIEIKGARWESTPDKTQPDGRNGLTSNVIAAHITGCKNIKITDFSSYGMGYHVKVDSTAELGLNENITVNNIDAVEVQQGVFCSYVRGFFGENWNIISSPATNSDSLNHAVYLSDNIFGLNLDSIYMENGAGYALKLQDFSSSYPYGLKLSKLFFKNVVSGIFTAGSTDISYSDITINGLSGVAFYPAFGKIITHENFKISNIQPGAKIFNCIANDGCVSIFINGHIDRGGKILEANSNNRVFIEKVYHNECAFGNDSLYFTNSAHTLHTGIVIRNCTFYNKDVIPSKIFSFRNNKYVNIDSNEFISEITTSQPIAYSMQGGDHLIHNNIFKGYQEISYVYDTSFPKKINNFNFNTGNIEGLNIVTTSSSYYVKYNDGTILVDTSNASLDVVISDKTTPLGAKKVIIHNGGDASLNPIEVKLSDGKITATIRDLYTISKNGEKVILTKLAPDVYDIRSLDSPNI